MTTRWSALVCTTVHTVSIHEKTWIFLKKSAEKNAKAYVPNAAPGRLRRVTSGKA